MKIIRVTSERELEQALAVRRSVFVEEQKVPEELEVDAFDESPGACRHFIVRDGGLTVAAGRWRLYDATTAKLQRIAVLEEFRGRGIGKALIRALEEDAAASGASCAILDGQCQAEPFYRSLGYAAESPEPFLDAGILHVRMRKNWA